MTSYRGNDPRGGSGGGRRPPPPPPPPPSDEFNSKKAKAARDEGMERVQAHNMAFRDAIAAFIDTKLPRGWTGIGEDIRRLWTGIQPHHPNCWGAICNAALKRGTLEKIPNAMRRPEAVKSHSRPTHVFRKL